MEELVNAEDDKVTIVGDESLNEIPKGLSLKYGTSIVELTISDCSLANVSNLEEFKMLKSLVLDNNCIGDDNDFPSLPKLETLWLNNNEISRLDNFLGDVKGKYPLLNYLSLLRNPCCPNYFVGKGSDDYKRYRATVVAALPQLVYLDANKVTKQEKKEAEIRNQNIARPSATEYKKGTSGPAVSEDKALPHRERGLEDGGAHFGRTRYVYSGKNSEGNRFIIDKNL